MPHRKAHRIVLNMIAVSAASHFPGNREDDEYVLNKVRQILQENVYEDASARDGLDNPEEMDGNVFVLPHLSIVS